MFAGMAWWAQRIYPVPYQWRRVVTAALVGVALVVAGKLLDANLAVALSSRSRIRSRSRSLGFYLPAERRAIGAPATAGALRDAIARPPRPRARAC